ncbi:GNAT family N-acetyltransferase [Pedobacter sp. KACC 23697]|uniref:N-acetyltransferase n=1 Tax=Pedobacter sp. KACC 23697 TaxID=3149230 RepID=A0AAU7K297_9SPHI
MKIITVHGIRRTNRWYENLPTFQEAKDHNLEILYFDYGYFSFWKFVRKKHREKILEKFCSFYSENIKDNKFPPSVVAHSFGTYIVYQAMKKYDVIKFDKIIFCGSILNEKTDFRPMIKNKQFAVLKNDHGSLEWFLKYTRRIIDKDCGKAGKVGFTDIPLDNINFIQNYESYKSHSEYFLPMHMKENWMKFFINGLSKFSYNHELLRPNIIDRIYENIELTAEPFLVNSISFFARIDTDGNYFAKYTKEGVNESNTTIEFLKFTTTADGFHDANIMNFLAYDKDNKKLNALIEKDINHQKVFKIYLNNPVKFKESINIKYYFCWYKTMNLKGDTDHWSIKNIRNINISLNFPRELLLPKILIIKNKNVIDQLIPNKKIERDNTYTYFAKYENLDNNDGAVFYFENSVNDSILQEKKTKNSEFSIRGRKDNYFITKAADNDIKNIYNIEIDIEHGNAASEETLNNRRKMFNDGFLVVKQRKNNKIVGYIETVIWNEKKFEKFEEISNFPLHFNINGSSLYVIFIAVDKGFRRMGIATRLLAEVENIAKRNNVSVIRLVAKDQVLSLYEKMDYKQIEELPNFLKGKVYKSILMEKRIGS